MTAGFVAEDQSDRFALLGDPASFGLPAGTRVARVDTHASAVFLAGDRALKLKRAVRFSFLDYSDAAKRRRACRDEVALNRRTAPDLYLGVAPIRRGADGTLALGALDADPPDAVDWVVVMRRFDEATLFDRQAAAGRLDTPKLAALAGEIATFHAEAEPPPAPVDWADAVAEIARGNVGDMTGDMTGDETLDPQAVAALGEATEATLALQGEALTRRAARVRRCHGDLHLRNICEIDGRPVLFDGIEFNESFVLIDPLYDLAFLLMGLDHRGLADAAALVRDRYLEATTAAADTDDTDGAYADLGVTPLYLSMRAAIRAKVSAAGAAVQEDTAAAARMRDEAAAYLARARRYLRPARPRLIAIGGYSGSGKSTLARAIAAAVPPAPGAVVLRSDRIRKDLMGVAETERLGADAYAPAVSADVYAIMEERAAAVLAAGQSAIADATFTHAESRARLRAVAERAGVAFNGLWLEAPAATLEARVGARRNDASDADAAVVAAQRAAGAGTIDWPRLAAGGPLDDLKRAALKRIDGGEPC